MPATSPEKPRVFFYCFGLSIQVTVVFFRDGWLLCSPEKSLNQMWNSRRSTPQELPCRCVGDLLRCVAGVSGFNKWLRHKFETYQIILAVKKLLKRRNAGMLGCMSVGPANPRRPLKDISWYLPISSTKMHPPTRSQSPIKSTRKKMKQR